ncbi:uncharacterized protein LOC142162156 [Nicotiana tabacum]|uniref:Uncharacterized protein LOC142162156 n=1 Tax=Nicotiana tabacum TaxID=4097 RepID=A0AC58RPC3_TOBAC
MEPIQQIRIVDQYRRRLGFKQVVVNVSNKIWIFIDQKYEFEILFNIEQHITLKVTDTDDQKEFVITMVYAKCDATERIELWDTLYNLDDDMSLPWLVGGDFNVIWDEEEKFGGLPVHINETDDFRHCINTCNLFDLGFKGSIFTWWNERAEEDCIFKRLDRCLRNMELQQFWPGLEINHLSKIGSDHSPMQIKCNPNSGPTKKAFRFMNLWIKNDSFLEVVKEHWQADFHASPFILFNHKMKKLKKALTVWSRATFGDIFQRLASLEEVLQVHETQFELNLTMQNRERIQRVQTYLIRVWALEEEFWKQKAEDESDIAEEAIHFFKQQFHEPSVPTEFTILDHVPVIMNDEQNNDLTRKPTMEEVKKAVFGLNGDSASGPDGFNGNFFHACWDIIGEDILQMVKAFFCGQELPKCVTYTNLVLLPKKKDVQTFSYFRPISLSNFTNKIISKVIHERLVDILPNVISDEQAGFVKGRNMVENVLLTQEIIIDIRLRTKAGPNVAIKLDMIKAYDRLSWMFLSKILRKMGFSEWFISLIFGIVSNNWYSILVNGQPHGFFKSTRGVKQGDPLSPTLFILAIEAMSRGLNALHHNLYFCGFGMLKWSPKINHLAYADDTIIFSSSDVTSLRLIMEVLNSYEVASGQLINKSKSAIYVHHSTSDEVVITIERVTGIGRQEFSFTYLGYPIFYSRRIMDFYEGLVKKVMKKLQTWKGKLLSIGGRAVLINSILQSMPIHLLSAVNPPANVINKLYKIFARTKPSLWSSFICQKYCKKSNAIVTPWRYGSHIWKKMLECRDLIEHQILWKLKMRSSLFWFDNWTGLGSLYFVVPQEFFGDENINNVNDVVNEGQWIEEQLRELLPGDLASHILDNIQCPEISDECDKPIWSLDTRGQFTVKTAWEYLRRRKDPAIIYSNMWVQGLPWKISFFMWKLWKRKLPLDDTIRRMRYSMPPKCWCCAVPNEKTLNHVFYHLYTASRVWSYFFSYAGLSLEGLSLHQAIVKCWTLKVIPRLKQIFLALPSIIVWELWKMRNISKHGEPVSTNRVVFQICTTIQSLIKVRKPGVAHVPYRWPDILKMMENYTPKLKFNKVLWKFSMQGWMKINTNGASRGNPWRSSIGFCLRNEHGDLLFACGKEIQKVTNTQAETKAILEALKHSRVAERDTGNTLLNSSLRGVLLQCANPLREGKQLRQIGTRKNDNTRTQLNELLEFSALLDYARLHYHLVVLMQQLHNTVKHMHRIEEDESIGSKSIQALIQMLRPMVHSIGMHFGILKRKHWVECSVHIKNGTKLLTKKMSTESKKQKEQISLLRGTQMLQIEQ